MVKLNKQKNSDTENLIYNQHGERLAILNTENIKICGWITRLEAMKKMHSVCVVFHIGGKFEFLVSQGSAATCLRWDGYCDMGCVANFVRFPAVQKFWKSVKIWQSYRQLKRGNFLRQCRPWADAQRDAAQPNIGGAVWESSVIPFLIPRRKVWMTPLLEWRAARLGRKVNFTRGEIPSGGKGPRKWIYTVNHKNVTFYFWL